MMGVSPEAYLSHFQRLNLFREPLGTWENGRTKDKWSTRDARMVAQSMEPLLAGRVVLFCGRRVGEAFGFCNRSTPFFEWRQMPLCRGHYRAAVMPHPSGRNHYWNSRDATREAERFLKDFVKTVNLGGCLLSFEPIYSPLHDPLDYPAAPLAGGSTLHEEITVDEPVPFP